MKIQMLLLCLCFTLCLTACKGTDNTGILPSAQEPSTAEPSPNQKKQSILEDYLGDYSQGFKLKEGGFAGMHLLIFKENDQFFGYLNIHGYKEPEGGANGTDIEARIAAEVRENQDGIGIYYLDNLLEGEDAKLFPDVYQEGELLFSLKKEEDGVYPVWENLNMSEPEGNRNRGLAEGQSGFSLKLMNEQDRAMFLRANGISEKKPFYEYYDQDGFLQMELYYDKTKRSGVGIFYDESQKLKIGFSVDDPEPGVWKDTRFSVWPEGWSDSNPDRFKVKRTYNPRGQLTYICAEGRLSDVEAPFWGKVMEVTFTYREDGTLLQKDCYYNSRVFGSTGSSESDYFDEKDRLLYTSFYITHGYVEDYYIYEEDSQEPAFCLTLDHTGDTAYAMFEQFIIP